LKGLLLAHRSAIRDLKKEVAQLRRQVIAVESSKKRIKQKARKQQSNNQKRG
jgi:phage shock protein A